LVDALVNSIKILFPFDVFVEVLIASDKTYVLHPKEAAYLEDMPLKRRKSFVMGRVCSKNSLSKIYDDYFPVLVGKNRQPLWPEKVTGSISHSGDYCASVVTLKNESLISIGFDIETSKDISDFFIDYVCTDWEKLNRGNLAGLSHIEFSKLVFSIKESFYKAIYPVLKLELDFFDVEVDFSEHDHSFRFRSLNQSINKLNIHGRYCITDSYVISGVSVYKKIG